MTDFIANRRQRRGFDRTGSRPSVVEIKHRAETAESMNQFQIACVSEVQPGGSGKWKIRENSEDPCRSGGSRWAGLFSLGRHCASVDIAAAGQQIPQPSMADGRTVITWLEIRTFRKSFSVPGTI